MEVLIKRRMLIEQAYRGRPDAPRFEGADHFMGFGDESNGTYIDPSAVRYQTSKIKEETGIYRELRLKREEEGGKARGKGAKGQTEE